MKNLTLREIQADLLAGRQTMSGIVDYYLINAKQNQSLNAYIEIFDEEIIEQAKALDFKINDRPNDLGKLFGSVISIKDLICYKDHKICASSKILGDFESQYTATALQRLLDEDVLVIGRTNCDEFGMGSENANSIYGQCYNAHGEKTVAGGSSGGAAVSVQIDSCLVALGSDTGGSVRQPASFAGLYGLKPTFGGISRYGLIAYASSFDQIGIITANETNLLPHFEVMAGQDPLDATSISVDLGEKPLKEDISFCFFNNSLNHSGLNATIKAQVDSLICDLKKSVTVDPVDFKYMDYLVACYYVLTTAEASSNLGRYDGVRYGFRSENSKDLNDMYVNTRTEGFGKEVKKRILLGTFVLSSEYFDSYFSQAQKVRKMVCDELERIFKSYDYILLPTTADVAWQAGNFDKDPTAVYLSDIFTVLANIAGIPSVTIPLGKDEDGFEFGLQILAKKGNDQQLLKAISQIELLAQ